MPKLFHHAGLTKFDRTRDSENHRLYPDLPIEIGKVHSIRSQRFGQRRLKEAEFLDSPFSYATALCGAKIKVILPKEFDPGEEDACQKCATLTHREIETGIATPGTLPILRDTPDWGSPHIT